MLQNRVDPYGNIIKTKARGTLMGNRGLIHSDQQLIVRPFKLLAWITCKLEFKGRRRKVMSPGLYTELFFLDEATSFAAGHRPCAECRRDAFNKFKLFWIKGNPEYNFDKKTPIREIDNILHQERIGKNKLKRMFQTRLAGLPDGVFLEYENTPFLLNNGSLYAWSPEGYGKGVKWKDNIMVSVLTPQSIVNAFKAGYEPEMRLTDFYI